MAYTVAPDFEQQYCDNNGDPLASGTIDTFLAGTSTPATTYQTSAGTANTNPIVLDSAGRATIFLDALSYKFVIKNSAGTTIKTIDNVQSMGLTALSSSFNDVVNGRLSLTTAVPVTVTDVTAATAVRFVPYQGNRINLYDGAAWNVYNFTELTILLGSDAADTNYDVFAYVSAGAAAIERLAWTNGTTRATALTTQDGVLVKSGDPTRRYIGTYRTTGTIGQTEDTLAKRFCWNYYNRVRRPMQKFEETNSWTYTTATIRQANGATANQLALVVGWAEVMADLAVAVGVANDNAAPPLVVVGIGEDSTTAIQGSTTGRQHTPLESSLGITQAQASLRVYPAVGYHFYAWLEYSGATGTTTWYGDNGGALLQSGIYGSIDG